MIPTLFTVAYRLAIPPEAFRPHAEVAGQRIARTPGLVWKIWGLNQLLFRLDCDAATRAARAAAIATGRLWFGPTIWQGRLALRMSVSSWQTNETHIECAIALLRQVASANDRDR
jgi:hypothetical protein